MTVSIVELTEHKFIDRLVREVRAGHRLVPFIGSGCSANSGILMGTEFSEYLGWTLARCVAPPGSLGLDERERWDLQGKGWPTAPNAVQLRAARRWVFEEYQKLVKQCELNIAVDTTGCRVINVTRSDASLHGAHGLARLLNAPILPAFIRSPLAKTEDLTDGSAQHRLLSMLTDHGLEEGGVLLQGYSPTSQEAIVERAIRSLYDWRATLRFLASLRIDGQGRLQFLDVQPNIIDQFHAFITRERRPNFIHTMLANLSVPARLRVVLTTNFDDLIEQAFAQQARSLTAISVTITSKLPDPCVVHAAPALIKLHGTLAETRADFSLDELPCTQDLRSFFSYVRGTDPSVDDASIRRSYAGPGQLLVAGYSGSDRRCVQMMKYVLENDSRALIFWVCNSEADLERLRLTFAEPSLRERVVCVRTERVDLLLYEFYQQLTLTLPAGGAASFHINHHVAPSEGFRPESPSRPVAPGADTIVKATELETEDASVGNIVVVDGPSGVARALASALECLGRAKRVHRVWLELDDYGSVASLVEDLFQVVASKRGQHHKGHADLCPEHLIGAEFEARKRVDAWVVHLQLLRQFLGIDPRQWVVALYGRNGPGCAVGWQADECAAFWNDAEYGELDEQRQKPPNSAPKPGELVALLVAMSRVGFTVLYAPYSESRALQDRTRPRDAREIGRFDLAMCPSCPAISLPKQVYPVPTTRDSFERLSAVLRAYYKPTDLKQWKNCNLTDVLRPIEQGDMDNRFRRTLKRVTGIAAESNRTDYGYCQLRDNHVLLHGASLMRQSRHYASFLNEGIMPCPEQFNRLGFDNDLVRYRRLESFIQALEEDVFLRKPGGLAWQYRDMRLCLRQVVETRSKIAEERKETVSGKPSTSLATKRSRTHYYIGEWYLRSYFMSNHANPLLEAAYHFFQGALWSEKAVPRPVKDKEGHAEDDLRKHRARLWRMNVNLLARTLRQGEPVFRLWTGRGQREVWFGVRQRNWLIEALKSTAPRKFSEPATKPAGQGEARQGALHEVDEQTIAILAEQLERISRLHQVPHGPSSLWLQGPVVDPANRTAIPLRIPLEFLDHRTPNVDLLVQQCGLDNRNGLLHYVRAILSDSGERDAKRVMHDACINSPEAALRIFQSLGEFAYWLLRRAKRIENAVPHNVEHRRLFSPADVTDAWLQVCRVAKEVVAMQAAIPPGQDAFVTYQVSKSLGLYGLALSRLGRFSEAHRRLNHAEALLGAPSQPDSLLHAGILELRRGEALLLEGLRLRELQMYLSASNSQSTRRLAPKEALMKLVRRFERAQFRRAFYARWMWVEPYWEAVVQRADSTADISFWPVVAAKAGDAWNCLERAASLLGGRTHHPLWWSRFRALQLLTISVAGASTENGRRTGTFNSIAERIQGNNGPRELWMDAIAVSPSEWHHRLRLLNYYVRARKTLDYEFEKEIREEWLACRENIRPQRELLSSAHLVNVAVQIAGLRGFKHQDGDGLSDCVTAARAMA